MQQTNEIDAGLAFWNERAKLGITAGTNDFMLTEIEQRFLVDMIPEGSRVLDVGCGNALSLLRLVKEKRITGVGIDFSEGMVAEAKANVLKQNASAALEIHHRRIPPVPTEFGEFDVVFSQRCLINLKTTDDQRTAVRSIAKVVKPGGMYIMLECSLEGGDRTNVLRKQLGLEPINPPWHNLFMHEAEVAFWITPDFRIKALRHISSTYHYLSRVVYAGVSARTDGVLKYDSEINKVSLDLPQEMGEFGPVKAWIWERHMPSKYDDRSPLKT